LNELTSSRDIERLLFKGWNLLLWVAGRLSTQLYENFIPQFYRRPAFNRDVEGYLERRVLGSSVPHVGLNEPEHLHRLSLHKLVSRSYHGLLYRVLKRLLTNICSHQYVILTHDRRCVHWVIFTMDRSSVHCTHKPCWMCTVCYDYW